MSSPTDLTDDIVVVTPPSVITVTAPGPQGRRGPEGLPGPPGDPDTLGHHHVQSAVVGAGQPVQIIHGLPYQPAGILALESDGGQIEHASVSWPATGIVELTFGVPFLGTVHLS